MRAYERLVRYAGYPSASNWKSDTVPSSPEQHRFAEALAEEMRELGLSEVYKDEHAYVYGKIPATKGYEDRPGVGFISHLDTVAECGTDGAKPQVIRQYAGEDIPLGKSGLVLQPARFAPRSQLMGATLVTTDGTTVLGGDDKAGIAEIMTFCEELLQSGQPHGKISVAFTPDEEIGHGAKLLDLQRFDVDSAYTLDGGVPAEIEDETFYAARATWEITGLSVHTGSAKGKMINAMLVAIEINAMLPPGETPEHTEGREGFFHLTHAEGNVSKAFMTYIIRDHDKTLFENRKALLREIEETINQKYGPGTAKVQIKDQYKNMKEVLAQHPKVLERAKRAIEKAGLVPVCSPIRGGTDGSSLCFRGLPCPNLGTGAYACHGPMEFAVAEQMDQMVEILKNVVDEYAED